MRIRHDFDMRRREARWGLAVSEAELKKIAPHDPRMETLIWKHNRSEAEELEVLRYVVNKLTEIYDAQSVEGK
jgi:hypothetical protein